MSLSHYKLGVANKVPYALTGAVLTTGKVFFVDSNAAGRGDISGDRHGQDPEFPYATFDYAVGRCTANKGDVILIAPNHSETLTTQVSLDVAGVKVIGLGEGNDRPTFTINAAIDGIDVSANDCVIEGIRFAASSASATAKINVDAARCAIRGCEFIAGASDTDEITITGNGTDCTIEDNVFQVTTNGPAKAIHIESHNAARLTIQYNTFNGGTATNSWDDGVIFSSGPHTNCVLDKNNFLYMSGGVGGIEFTAAATGLIRENFFGGGTLGQMLDPGSCYCMDNKEADAVDENARTFPTSDAS